MYIIINVQELVSINNREEYICESSLVIYDLHKGDNKTLVCIARYKDKNYNMTEAVRPFCKCLLRLI